MKVLGCYAVKGGVGKTTTAVNLAWLSAQAGNRTLLWDLDAQAAASFLLRTKPKVKGGTRRLLQGKSEAARAIKGTSDPWLDILPADTMYASADVDLRAAKRSADRVAKVLRAVSRDYDVAVVDCPPGFSLLSTNVVRAADIVLVPIVPSPLSLRTLDQVVDLAAQAGGTAAVVAFLSMVDRRRTLHRDVVELVMDRYGDVAQTVIPNNAVVERMGLQRRPVVATSPRNPATVAYRHLWNEVAWRLNVRGEGRA